jgi:group I intron endonuclease
MIKFGISGIYQIKCVNNGKIYIGSAVDIKKRWQWHKDDLRGNSHHCKHLQNAWKKYGEQSFIFEIIEIVNDKTMLLLIEQQWIDKFCIANNDKKCVDKLRMYNSSPTAGSSLGVERSAETRARMSIAFKARKLSPEALANMAAGRLKTKGRKVSEEIKQKTRDTRARNPYKFSLETKKKMSAWQIGKKHSQETKDKIAAKATGRPVSKETGQKISDAIKGRVFTEEWLAKIVAFHTGRKRSPETRAKIAAARKSYLEKKKLLEQQETCTQ